MSIGWQLLQALHDLLTPRLDATVSYGLPNGIESGDYLAVGVSDPEAAGRPATAYSSNFEWSTSIAPGGPFDEVGEVSLAAVAIRSDDEMQDAVDAAFKALTQTIAALRAAWSDHDLLGVPGLWDLKPGTAELATARLDGAAVAYLLIRLSFQATL